MRCQLLLRPEIARRGEESEVMAAFPELQPLLDGARTKVDALVGMIEGSYTVHKHHGTQKDFALAVKHLPYSAALFQLRGGKTDSARAFVRDAPIKWVLDRLGVEDAEVVP